MEAISDWGGGLLTEVSFQGVWVRLGWVINKQQLNDCWASYQLFYCYRCFKTSINDIVQQHFCCKQSFQRVPTKLKNHGNTRGWGAGGGGGYEKHPLAWKFLGGYGFLLELHNLCKVRRTQTPKIVGKLVQKLLIFLRLNVFSQWKWIIMKLHLSRNASHK